MSIQIGQRLGIIVLFFREIIEENSNIRSHCLIENDAILGNIVTVLLRFIDLYKQVTSKAVRYQMAGAKNGMMLNTGGSAMTNYMFIVGK